MAKIIQNEVWADTLQLMRAHWVALVAIAGVFNFLPVLLVNHFIERPDTTGMAGAQALMEMGRFLRHNFIWYVLQSFVLMIGSAAMLRLVFRQQVTVGGALWYGILVLPAYSVMLFFVNFGAVIGLFLFIVPGLYVWGRLFPAGAVMVAEDRRHPIETIRRAWALTAGNGWQILLLYVAVALVGAVLVLAAEQLAGILFIVAAGQALGKFLAGVVVALLTAAVATVLTMLGAAVYRALAPQKP